MPSQQARPKTKIQIITIDGPAGAGKSTVAKQLARALNFAYLDTGAMYRALTLKALRQNILLTNEDALADLAKKTNLDLEDAPQGVRVILDGVDVSQEIRTLEVTNNTFYIARASKVREILVDWQRKIGQKKSVVAEGRDVGTVVFPDAAFKFYLDADVDERTRRRFEELKIRGTEVEWNQLKQEVEERDQKDLTRKTGPLRQAEDAIRIDSTGMTAEMVVSEILRLMRKNG